MVTLALIASTVLALWHDTILTVHPLHNAFAIGIVLALSIGGALKGYVDNAAFSEEAKQFRRVATVFRRRERMVRRFAGKSHREELNAALIEAGTEALRKRADWLLLHRGRPAEVPAGG